ncbi:MAG: glycosyltransferase family 39 protein [Candidatus Aminicenantales bacterium]
MKSGLPLPVILASIAVFVFCSLFSTFVFERIPHINDEIAYLFQAKIFHSGRLYVPSPPCREFFDFPHIINNGRWYSIYPPGFPLLLAIGLIFRAPWLVNPLLAALSVILFYFLGREIYSPKVGLIAALLSAISPWFLVMSSTMLSHTASMFFNALFLLFLFRSIRSPSPLLGLAAGISWGLAFLVRPVNTLFSSFVFLVYYAFRLMKKRRGLTSGNAPTFAVTTLVFAGFFLVYNQLTNGAPFRMGYLVRYGPSYSVVFGQAATLDSAFTPLSAAVQMVDNLKALNVDLFGWPLSSFLAMLPLLWLTRLNPEDRKKDLLLASSIAVLVAAFSFFWGAFVFVGARMLFDAVPLFLLLSARGIAEIPGLVSQVIRKTSKPAVRKMTVVLVCVLAVYGFFFHLPHRLRPAQAHWFFDRYDHRFAGTSARLGRAIESLSLGRALVILKFWHRPPPTFPEEGGWGSGLLYNGPELDDDIIYAKSGDKNLAALFPCYPDRNVYVYTGTLDMGILIPVRSSQGAIKAEEPVRPSSRMSKAVEIVQDPVDIFHGYSPGFSRFLEELFQEIPLLEMDGKRLENLGVLYQSQADYKRASFSFEAALQIENDPATRRNLFNRLVPCYQKAGQTDEARRILDFMESVDFDERRLYNVFPERGF